MEKKRLVLCPENEELASYMWEKRQEMVEADGFSDRIDSTIYRAYASVCSSKNPIKTVKEFSKVKGVGNWTIRLMKGFFPNDAAASPSKEMAGKGKKMKGPRHYVPQKNSVAYALLITLYREISNGSTFMRKQELINAAEASGLSRTPIAPEKGKGKLTQLGSSPHEWYSGWSCMKTLITKGLIVKSSCPAKYMLTQEGQAAARECLLRSGLADSSNNLIKINELPSCQTSQDIPDIVIAPRSLDKEAASAATDLGRQKKSVSIPLDIQDKLIPMGYSEDQIRCAFEGVSESSRIKESCPALLHAVLNHLQNEQVHSLDPDFEQNLGNKVPTFFRCTSTDIGDNCRTIVTSDRALLDLDSSSSAASEPGFSTMRACTSSDYSDRKSLDANGPEGNMKPLAMPPRGFGLKFEDVYDVILILDDREQFAKNSCGSRPRKVIESMCTQFKIQVEVRRLPVGDGIWIARHKHLDQEYVLDFIVERKEVDDLRVSIRDNRYRDQKLRLQECGLQKLIYVVEGDPNSSEAAESIKTACFTTEILEGFDIQRTSCLTDTLKRYGHLTHSISSYYRTEFSNDKNRSNRVCPSYAEFVKKCQDLEKMTVSDVFAVQLMQVPQVTEDIAYAVLDLYPTLFSLARAYSHLEGNIRDQEEMLRSQSNLISTAASKNIFKLVWC